MVLARITAADDVYDLEAELLSPTDAREGEASG